MNVFAVGSGIGNGIDCGALCVAVMRVLRRGAYVSGVLLATLPARAEAPTLSAEFWNYLVEFGDSRGELFDPADFAALANMPAQTRDAAERAHTDNPAHAQSPKQNANDKRAQASTVEESPQ